MTKVVIPVIFNQVLYLQLMKTLPPLVSVVVWDVINDRIDELTIKLAQATSKEEFERYDLMRSVAAADPKHPPFDLAKGLVENMALVQ
jgi:hypothetical protein